MSGRYSHYSRYPERNSEQPPAIVNILGALAGVLAIVAFLMLPWLTLATPIINIFQFDISAQFLAAVAGMFPGYILLSLWLVPLAGIVAVAASTYGLVKQTSTIRTIGKLQIMASVGLLLPVLAVAYTYMNFLGTLRGLIPIPIALPIEAVIFPGLGLYLTAILFATCLYVGIANLRSRS